LIGVLVFFRVSFFFGFFCCCLFSLEKKRGEKLFKKPTPSPVSCRRMTFLKNAASTTRKVAFLTGAPRHSSPGRVNGAVRGFVEEIEVEEIEVEEALELEEVSPFFSSP